MRGLRARGEAVECGDDARIAAHRHIGFAARLLQLVNLHAGKCVGFVEKTRDLDDFAPERDGIARHAVKCGILRRFGFDSGGPEHVLPLAA